jgi:hypothetical protein
MMKRSRTFPMSWRLPTAVLASTALTAGTFAVFGQAVFASPETQNAAPTILLSGPSGDRFTLVHSADAGWRLQAGWNAEERSKSAGLTKAVLATVGALPVGEQQALERPLTVFVDGPTGFTFMYVLDGGWKFVGRLADRAR